MIHLPDFLKPAPMPEPRVMPLHAPENITSVLLVDDEPAIRSLFAMCLRRDGYFVVEAQDGEAALAAAEATGRIDVVVTDIKMPRMDGLKLADALRAVHPDMDVIFVSGYPLDHGRLGPHTHLLNKPFLKDDLMQVLTRVAGPPARTH